MKSENIHFVMGDFNINSLDHEMRLILDHALCGYELVVNNVTHLNGSIIDHIYIKKILKQQFKVVIRFVQSMYYSDHEFVKVLVRN